MSDVINIKQASELVGLTVNTLYSYCARRKIPHLKLGAKLLFRRSELEAWLDAHRVPVGARG